MNERNPNPQEPQDSRNLDRLVSLAFSATPPEEVRKRAQHHFTLARVELERRGEAGFPARHRAIGFRFAWAGAGALCGFAGLLVALLLTTPAAHTWADVVQNLQGVKAYHMTVYVAGSYFRPREKIELWHNADGKVRAHLNEWIAFGEGGEVTQLFNVRRQESVSLPLRGHPVVLQALLSTVKQNSLVDEFTLDMLLQSKEEEVVDREELSRPTTSPASDLQVFYLTSTTRTEWARVWVLRKSGLPVRLVHWDPRDEDHMEFLFDYLEEQPAEAFDPALFEGRMHQLDEPADRVYALLREPGGQPVTPNDLPPEKRAEASRH